MWSICFSVDFRKFKQAKFGMSAYLQFLLSSYKFKLASSTLVAGWKD